MTFRMADGPVANLPPGLDAYAGYTNVSGIGLTYPAVVAKYPNAKHLSITTDGSAALCADVEWGAMNRWTGYPVGYCAVSNVNALVEAYGRPLKLWTAHYDPRFGAHICGPKTCNYGAAQGNPLVTSADGTQWTNHGSANWDESLLLDDFFVLQPQPVPPTGKAQGMITRNTHGGGLWEARSNGDVYTAKDAQGTMAPYLGPLPKYLSQWGIGTAANPVVGIVDDGVGGFFLEADSGGPSPTTYHITADGQYAR